MRTEQQIAELIELTEETIKSASTTGLRGLADEYLGDYQTHQNVLDVRLTPEVVGQAGALARLDALVQLVKAAHRDDDPIVASDYGRVQVKTWETDESLRQSLIYVRRNEIKKAEAAASEEPAPTYQN